MFHKNLKTKLDNLRAMLTNLNTQEPHPNTNNHIVRTSNPSSFKGKTLTRVTHLNSSTQLPHALKITTIDRRPQTSKLVAV